ncbi:hypothetical protein SDJN02_24442, partial [Cucurbita argyrosperma subsp. argyrosperma]
MEKEIADRKATVINEVQENNDGESEEITERESTRKEEEHPLPLMALNHVSRVCRSVKDSVDFYTKVLGFVLIERPQSFDFEGAWLFNYGVGIHLMQSEDEDNGVRQGDKDHLDPLDNHISFQCLKVVPAGSSGRIRLPAGRHNPPLESNGQK